MLLVLIEKERVASIDVAQVLRDLKEHSAQVKQNVGLFSLICKLSDVVGVEEPGGQ